MYAGMMVLRCTLLHLLGGDDAFCVVTRCIHMQEASNIAAGIATTTSYK
jgi:hypothetical protein